MKTTRAHAVFKTAFLASVALVLFSFGGATAYLYMYEPGDPVPSTYSMWDEFGIGNDCRRSLSGSCIGLIFMDETICDNTPANVSRTPLFKSIDVRRTDQRTSGYIGVDCNPWGQRDSRNVTVVYRTDGRMPDIFVAHTNVQSATIRYDENTRNFFVVARCLEEGKLPSRIAYFERVVWDETVNGSWCDQWSETANYKELDLPRCRPELVGWDKCDGQTVVAHPAVSDSSTSSVSGASHLTFFPIGKTRELLAKTAAIGLGFLTIHFFIR